MCRAQVLQLGPTWQFSAGTVESVVLERSALGSLHLAKPLFHRLLRLAWEQVPRCHSGIWVPTVDVYRLSI